jgi:tetrahydromethanopterin S-methyltransferase subunit B
MGTFGYCYFGSLDWADGLLNAAMILTGMGPVDRMTTTAGKLFATFYALYSGIAFLTMMAILIAPILHRFLHKFHLDEES